MRASWVEGALILTGAIVGWYATRRWRIGTTPTPSRPPSSDYLAGLNYLVNEQPDRAVEAFLRAVAVDRDTVETQFALGALFRRRGEVDRAIRMHQNLMTRTELDPVHREQATYALAQDYLRAGLYDRAEKLLLTLSEAGTYRISALRDLCRVYEVEHDWERAIEVHRELAQVANPLQPLAIAHYWCELAEQAMAAGDYPTARRHLAAARAEQRRFPRGALLRADLFIALKEPALALKLLKRVAVQQPALAGEVLPRLVKALKAAGREDEVAATLRELAADGREVADAFAHAAIVAQDLETPGLQELARDYVSREPTVAEMVAALLPPGAVLDADVLKRLCNALRRQALRAPRFRCAECGFSSTGYFWQCPGCKAWDGLKPLTPTELLAPLTAGRGRPARAAGA
jgi:lipopolysaccharide biosynthesis regulator YciM